ncbi:MAG: hypothetical protein HYR66_18710 [Sphingobacteriales bacterium]|nr:hypothetical protein [Sphingobacteriales bacterium]MBI3719504.1 hypothetical protein [Sphingobacteriales bacterium]
MKPIVTSFILLLVFSFSAFGQTDTLPKFSLVAKDRKITINWINRYPNAQQISIQRSKDSLKNFLTIHSLPDPSLKKYTFIDDKAPNDSLYYRVFVLIGGVNYFFTPAKRPFIDTTKPVVIIKPADNKDGKKKTDVTKDNSPTPDHAGNGGEKNEKNDKEGKDEDVPPPVKKWAPSIYVFTSDDGNVSIVLPEYKTKKYHIKFFEENDTPIFELHEVKESPLLLDKVNFLHSGWFKFELYQNGKLLEKSKFLITRDN